MVLGRFKLGTLFSEAVAPGEAGTAATLLLALLGVFATWLIRPGEHPLAAKLLLAARLLILADVAAVLIDVGDLVLHISRHPPDGIWEVLAGVSVFVAALLTLSLLLPRSHKPETLEAPHSE